MRLLCITEPSTHPSFDTTVELYNKLAEHEGVTLFHAEPHAAMEEETIKVGRVERALNYEEFLALNECSTERFSYADFDLVFSRTDKPFPPGYHEALARHEGRVLFVNSPSGCEEVSQRTFLSRFAHLLPDHVSTRDAQTARRFIERFRTVVAKRNMSYGGKGVYKLALDESGSVMTDNIVEGERRFDTVEAALSFLFGLDGDPVEFVRFLSRIGEGDKRVLVVDGAIYGGFLRRSKSGHWVHNITVGGGYEAAEVTPRERAVIEETAHEYHARGVYTLGYDFLMDDDGTWILSEVNAGNIGGYGRLARLTGEPVYERLIDWLIARSRSRVARG